MPRRKQGYFKRRVARKLYRRYRRRGMGRRLSAQNHVYMFKRTCQMKPWAMVDTVPTEQSSIYTSNLASAGIYNFGHYRFRLNMLPGTTDFTNLYERYKIVGVKLRFVPATGTDADVERTGSTAIMPTFAYAINRNAITVAADDRNLTDLMENQDLKLRNAAKPFSIYIAYPKFYAPADGLTVAQVKSGWLSTKHADVDHFGLNWAWSTTTATSSASTSFQVFATFYIKCANPQ